MTSTKRPARKWYLPPQIPPIRHDLISVQKAESSGQSDQAKTAEAERLKSQGNSAVTRKDYIAAIDYYTQALNLVPDNKIYLSNRAAAYSQSGQHSLAASDALRAVEIDPGYAKAWSRLGHARYALGDAKGSMEAYEKGLKCEGGQTDVTPLPPPPVDTGC